MGWEQRPHSAGSSPDSFCLHLGPSERLTCILVALQRVVLTPAAPTRQAAGGCREVRAGAWLRSAATATGSRGWVHGSSYCVQPCLGAWLPPDAAWMGFRLILLIL